MQLIVFAPVRPVPIVPLFDPPSAAKGPKRPMPTSVGGILPNEHSNLIGLSKYARICDWIMSRPQIQEEAVTMLANELQSRVKPDGLAIVMEADHFCMQWRGVKDNDSMMTNSVMRGAFLKDSNLRREFLSLLGKKN